MYNALFFNFWPGERLSEGKMLWGERVCVCVCLIYLLIVLSLSYSSTTLSARRVTLGPSREV